MFTKIDFQVVGKAFLGAAKHHLSKPEVYLIAGSIGLGAGLADKSVKQGLKSGYAAALGVVGFTAMATMPEVRATIMNEVIKTEDN